MSALPKGGTLKDILKAANSEDVLSHHDTSHQILHIRVIGADDLKKVDSVGWSDPYCIVYANGTKIGKTGIKKNTKKPVWNEVFDVSLHHGHADIKFEMYDWDAIGKHRFLGAVFISSDNAAEHYDHHNLKFTVEKMPGKPEKYNKHVQGNLFLSFSVMTDEQSRMSALKDEGGDFDSMQFQNAPRIKDLQRRLSVTTEHQVLHLHVVKATDVKKCNAVGWSDPYIIAYANDTKIGKTPVQKSTKTPVWNEVYDIDLHYGHVDLRFEMFDWDRVGKHTFMGMVNIDTDEIQQHYGKHNVSFQIKPDPNRSDKQNKKVGGSLFLSFSVMTDTEAKSAAEKEEAAKAAQLKALQVDEEKKAAAKKEVEQKLAEKQLEEEAILADQNAAKLRQQEADARTAEEHAKTLQAKAAAEHEILKEQLSNPDGMANDEQHTSTEHQMLHIRILGADDLKKVDTVGSTDAFCVAYANGTKIGKSDTKKNTKAPRWNAVFDTSLHYGHVDLRFEVYHSNKMAKNKFLGLIDIDANDAASHYDKHNMKFQLEPDTSKDDKYNKYVQGSVYISFSVMTDEALRSAQQQEALLDSEAAVDLSTFEVAPRVQSLQRRLSVSTAHQILHLHVIGAENIKRCDSIGWSDPYVIAYANDTKIGKTSVQKSTKKPVWNEIYDVDLHYGHVHLRFEMYDWDRVGSHTFMGMVEIDTDEIKKQYGKQNVPFEIKPDPKRTEKQNKKAGGQLLLSFSVMTDELAKAATEKEEMEKAAAIKDTEEKLKKMKSNEERKNAERKALEQQISEEEAAALIQNVKDNAANKQSSLQTPQSTEHQMLHIRILGADDLKKVDTVGSTDAFCVAYANGTKIGKSDTKKNTKAPRWNAVFDTSLHYGHVDLRFEVYHSNKMAKNKFLGLIDIDANDAASHYDKHNMKFQLEPDTSKDDKYNKYVQGSVYISFSVMTDEALRSAQQQEALLDSEAAVDLSTFEVAPRVQSLQRRLSVSTAHQILHLHVIGAENIKRCDSIGWSDPYVIAYANDTKIGKTSVQKSTKKPVWNEIYDVDLHYGHVHLRFEMYDWDRVGSHTFMGMVEIDTDEIKKQYGKQNVPFEIKPDPKRTEKQNKKAGGQLLLSFSVMTDELAKAATEKEEMEKAAAIKDTEEKLKKMKAESEKRQADKLKLENELAEKEELEKLMKFKKMKEEAAAAVVQAEKDVIAAAKNNEDARKKSEEAENEVIRRKEVHQDALGSKVTSAELASMAQLSTTKTPPEVTTTAFQNKSAELKKMGDISINEIRAAIETYNYANEVADVKASITKKEEIDPSRVVVEIKPTVSPKKKSTTHEEVDITKAVLTPLLPPSRNRKTKTKKSPTKTTTSPYKPSPTKPMTAGELDREMIALKKAYAASVNLDELSGPFRQLVENERRKQLKKTSLPSDVFDKIDKAASKSREASPLQKPDAYASAHRSQAIVNAANSPNLLEISSPTPSHSDHPSWSQALEMMQVSYAEMEKKNAHLQQVIVDMSRREEYLVENANLKAQISRMEEERHFLIKASAELGEALRLEKTALHEERAKAITRVVKDAAIQSLPPTRNASSQSPRDENEIINRGTPFLRTTPDSSPRYRQIFHPSEEDAVSPPLIERTARLSNRSTDHVHVQGEKELVDRRAQLRLDIADLREIVSIGKMNNIVAGRPTLHGLEEHVSRLQELRFEFSAIEKASLSPSKTSPKPEVQKTLQNKRNDNDGGQDNWEESMKQYGIMVPLSTNKSRKPIEPSFDKDIHRILQTIQRDKEASRIVEGSRLRADDPRVMHTSILSPAADMADSALDFDIADRRASLLREKERLMAEINALESAEKSHVTHWGEEEAELELRPKHARSSFFESERTSERSSRKNHSIYQKSPTVSTLIRDRKKSIQREQVQVETKKTNRLFYGEDDMGTEAEKQEDVVSPLEYMTSFTPPSRIKSATKSRRKTFGSVIAGQQKLMKTST